jgi:trehalose 6-phosphate synthase/phosphatase
MGICMQERRERHRQNYMHVTIHTSQTWADTFISELNDTHVEAELRTKHIPPQVEHPLPGALRHCFL